jgi:transcriptional regulator with XRE-family HTH domain
MRQGDGMNIGERMKAKRLKLGLSAKEVAAKVSVATSTYRDWEEGRSINGEPYVQITEALELSIEDLLGLPKGRNDLILLELTRIDTSLRRIRKNV